MSLSDSTGFYGGWLRFFGDLDADGSIDVLLALPRLIGNPASGQEVCAVSLRDGKKLWSQTIRPGMGTTAGIQIGDLDGDGQTEVVALEDYRDDGGGEPRIRVFEGRDGKVRWTWPLPPVPLTPAGTDIVALADFEGNGAKRICVSCGARKDWLRRSRRIVVLDGKGKEVARRDVVDDEAAILNAVDLDNDGRDELLVCYGGVLHAWDRNLKDLWVWPIRFDSIDRVIPAAFRAPA